MDTFTSHQVKGYGRGNSEVVPTINLAIPPDIDLAYGIYGAQVTLKIHDHHEIFTAAMHYGPKPTFPDTDISLEVFLILTDPHTKLPTYDPTQIRCKIVGYIRPIIKFGSAAELKAQIAHDVEVITTLTQPLG